MMNDKINSFLASVWKRPSLFLCLCAIIITSGFRYDSQGRRDPFQTPTQSNESGQTTGTFKLEGIILDPVGPALAVINGEVVREGETLEGYLVQEISEREVLLSKGKELITIPLNEDFQG